MERIKNVSDDPEFNELLRKAVEAFEALPEAEKEKQRQAQRESWVYGQLRLSGRDVTRESVREAIKKHDAENPS